AGEPALMPFP
ncbi:hypothetical protein EC880221_2878, partial [Escherichia coli 88.0221]